MNKFYVIIFLMLMLTGCGAPPPTDVQVAHNNIVETNYTIYQNDEPSPLKRVIDKEFNIACYWISADDIECFRLGDIENE